LMRMPRSANLDRPASAALRPRRERAEGARAARFLGEAAPAGGPGSPGRQYLAQIDRALRGAIEPAPPLDVAQMVVHRPRRDLGPPQGERLDQRRMLVDRGAGLAGRLVQGDDQRGARDELAEEPRDRPVAREVGEQQMEFAGAADQAMPLARRARLALLGDVAAQLLEVGGARLPRQPNDHMGLE